MSGAPTATVKKAKAAAQRHVNKRRWKKEAAQAEAEERDQGPTFQNVNSEKAGRKNPQFQDEPAKRDVKSSKAQARGEKTRQLKRRPVDPGRGSEVWRAALTCGRPRLPLPEEEEEEEEEEEGFRHQSGFPTR